MKKTELRRKTPLHAKNMSKVTSTPKQGLKRKNGANKRKKKTDLQRAKEKLWQLTRQIVFQRYGTDCYTCGAKNLTGTNRQCGHFITKSTCSTEMAYSYENCRTQCWRCNINLSGNWLAFEQHLIQDGVDVEALKQRNRDTKGLKYGLSWFEAQIAYYETLI